MVGIFPTAIWCHHPGMGSPLHLCPRASDARLPSRRCVVGLMDALLCGHARFAPKCAPLDRARAGVLLLRICCPSCPAAAAAVGAQSSSHICSLSPPASACLCLPWATSHFPAAACRPGCLAHVHAPDSPQCPTIRQRLHAATPQRSPCASWCLCVYGCMPSIYPIPGTFLPTAYPISKLAGGGLCR